MTDLQPASTTRTQVAIVGGGPAGLMLSHLLHQAGIESVVVDNRTAHTIETTHRAGILERDSVRLLVDSGVDRVLRDGHRHEGIDLRFGGVSHRIDFEALVGASCWLYPQTDVFIDLHARRTADGGDLRYGITDTEVLDVLDAPRVRYTDADGARHEIVADLEAKGVAFEHYPQMPGVVLRGNIHHMGPMRLVWLKDPDGNILHLNNL